MTLKNESSHNSSALTIQRNLTGLIRTMRLRQWTKNIVIYAGLVFDGKLFQWEHLLNTTLVVFCFCLISSCVYIINDLTDIEKDRLHPKKRHALYPQAI
ncbi:MAG: hypothetical protein R2932_24930 [Caldilineaceae bacterium]